MIGSDNEFERTKFSVIRNWWTKWTVPFSKADASISFM